ncbi:MAG: hypothetical protein M0Q46_04435 [Endomicrobiales bacterium]|nr:hypothetical protein [Endomicrobiales bacterium]
MKNEYTAKKITYGWFLFAAFVFSMAAVVTTANAFVFLVFWEIMSLVSYFLVVFDTGKKQSVNAGALYIIMTHIGTAFIIAAFILMYKHSGSFEFSAIKNAAALMTSSEKNLIFAFLLIGFGTKAGVVPLHLWLPYAHPQAPSHISSVMSGVMIKIAIYGLVRFVFFVLGVNSLWWGNIVLLIAAISCLVGVIYALMEHDIKKLLAYHSVENIGIILFGVGAAMVFIKLNMPVLAVLALSAGLYHLINHAVFKSLLFLCAGSVYKATGLRDMEKMGGLIKFMPWTAAFFLFGALAISAIPPFNGFVSEWLVFQSFFAGALNCPTAGARIMMGIYASVLALTGGLAAACFVKAFGITFLAMPRSKNAQEAKEAPFSMKISMAFLAILTLVLGLAAPFILKIISNIAVTATGPNQTGIWPPVFSLKEFTTLPSSNGLIGISPVLILLMLVVTVGITVALVYVFARKRKVSTGLTWDCGYYKLDSRTEYTATAFSKPFRIAFSFFLKPYTKTEKIKESQYHIKSFRYELYNTYVFKKYFYKLGLEITLRAARYLKRLQAGSIHLYIAYIFLAILVLMFFYGK